MKNFQNKKYKKIFPIYNKKYFAFSVLICIFAHIKLHASL